MADQSLLLYTRHYLAQDYRLGPLPRELCRLPPIDPITDIRDPFTFSPSDDLDNLPLDIDHSEKLILNHATAVYLSSIIRAPDEDQHLLLEDFRWSSKLRIEEPSVQEQERKQVHRVSEDVLSFKPSVGRDEDSGIEWERDVRHHVWDYVRGIETEKMVIGSEVLEFLQSIHRPEKPPSTTDVIQQEVQYCKSTNSRFMTPPLLPISPIITPSPIRLSSTLDLKPLDGGETALLVSDLAAPFIAADSILDPHYSESSDFLQTTPTVQSPIRKRPRPETLLIEAPITPPMPTIKKVRFADLPIPPRISTPPGEELEASLDAKVLIRMSQELAQEQLQEADSTLRVGVPFVDFSIPALPWDNHNVGGGLERLRDLKAWAGVAARHWGGAASVGMDLSWRPFSKSAAKAPTEDLGNAEGIDETIILLGDGENAENELIEGLRTMGLSRHEDGGHELEAGVFTAKTDMETLLKSKKRKGPKTKKPTHPVATGKDGAGNIGEPNEGAPLSISPLDTFMALRSRVSKKPKLSSEAVSRTITIQEDTEREKTDIGRTVPPVLINEVPTFPLPQIILPSSPGIFIASTTLLSQRRLFRLILDFYPTATVIERDFTVPITDHFAGIISSHKDSVEADLILSPLCGLIFTSLQKIRQAPMPGKTLNTTRQRVLNVSLLYERLFVIVLGTVHGSDSETVAGFIGFAAGLQAGVNIRILKEDDDVVAKWVVSLMIREGKEGKLLEDETLWERFLRKAGFNAFAAQVVLRYCRDGGLRAFLAMSSGEKRMAFSGLVGDRVIERVLERLEGEWDTNT